MSKLGLLRAAITSSIAVRTAVPQNRGLPMLLGEPARRFSTEAENPPQNSRPSDQPQDASPIEPFLQTPTTGLVYGKLLGISRYTLKTDVVNMLEGCNLSLEDVKVDYNRAFTPMGMVVQFRSWKAFDNAARVISRKGRLFKLERANRSQWDNLTPHDAKTVLLQGIPQTAAPEDVERFLSGCEYDSSSLQIIFRSFPEPSKFATVRFPSQTEAMNAFLAKNKGYCQNGQILMRVLQ
ncbi:hypothetical protein ACFX15_031928 [Malus domestica]|nr:uncharacterized protein LOC103408360 [Malus domestica]XP_050143821.1 uncharacterized protein LOC126619467 [Malus sylvestris]